MNASIEHFSNRPDKSDLQREREGGFAVSTQSLYREVLRVTKAWPHVEAIEPVKAEDPTTLRSFQVSFLRRSSRIVEVNVVELSGHTSEAPLIFCVEMIQLEERFTCSVNQRTHHEEVPSGKSLFILERVIKAASQELKKRPTAHTK